MWRYRKDLHQAWLYTRGHRLKLGWVVALTILVFVISLAEPWPLALLIDHTVDRKDLPGWAQRLRDWSPTGKIVLGVATMVGLALLRNALSAWSEYLQAQFELRTVLAYRSRMFEHAQKLSLHRLDQQRAGSFIFNINFHAHSIGAVITAMIPLASSVLTIVGTTIVLVRFDVVIGLIALSVMPFIVYSTIYYANRIEPEIERVRDLEGSSMSIVHESVSMMRVLTAFCRERFEHAVFLRNGERGLEARVRLTVRQTLFLMVVNTITVGGTAAVLGYSVHLAVNDKLSVGSVYVILAYVHNLMGPLEHLTGHISHLQVEFVNLRVTRKLLDIPIEIDERPGAIELPPTQGWLTFDNVTVAYDDRDPVVREFSFEVHPGDVIAIVGPTGAGKTTLMSTIMRFLDPSEGRVLIDGYDLRDLTVESIRSQVALVSQEPLLWARTIKQNIAYGRPDATDPDIQDAAIKAGAHDFIARLPEGYDTPLGERGAGLSGGEKQRIAIARAFLKNAPILVLDEPTSSIDSRTEAVILDALDRLMVGRTTFVIAHRLSTTRSANQILVMDRGRLVEQGTHDQLMAYGELYRELWDAQAMSRPDSLAGVDS